MTQFRWSKMPCTWQIDQVAHAKLRAAPCGDAIAGLKLYIAICLKANFAPNVLFPRPGCVRRSLTQLSDLTGLSKPMTISGLRLLQNLGFVERLPGRPATYRLTNYESSSYWAKLPQTYLHGFGCDWGRRIELLATLPNRGQVVFEALQLYLYIASIRVARTQKAHVTYTKICTVLGVSRNAASRAISFLVAKDLISVRPDDDGAQGQHACNVYRLLGRIDEREAVAPRKA